MVVQRPYGAEIYGMISGVGDRFVENRQNALRNEIAQRSYARQLEQDELAQKNWLAEQEFEREKWNTQSQLQRDEFELEKQKAAGAANDPGEWGLTPGFYDAGGKGDPKDFVPTYTSKNGRMTVGGDPTPYDLSGNALDGSGKKLDMTRYLSAGEKELVRARGTAEGKAAGEVSAGAAKNAERIDQSVIAIDDVINNPKLDSYVGAGYGLFPAFTQEARDLEGDLDYILSNAFLQGYDDIRGAGAITEREGIAAEKAQSKLRNVTMSPEKYREALQDYKNHLLRMRELAFAIKAGEIDPDTGAPLKPDPSIAVGAPAATAEPAGGPPAPGATTPAPTAVAPAPAPAPAAVAAPAPAATAVPAPAPTATAASDLTGEPVVADDGKSYRQKAGTDGTKKSHWVEVPAGAPATAPAAAATAGADRGFVTTTNSAGSPAATPPPKDPVVTPIPNSPPPRQPTPGGTPGAGTLGGMNAPGMPAPLVEEGLPQGAPAEGAPEEETSRWDQIKQAAYEKGKAEIIRRAVEMQKRFGTPAAQQWAEARFAELRQRFAGEPAR